MTTILERSSVSSDTPDVLDRIGESDTSLAIWQRDNVPDFAVLLGILAGEIRLAAAVRDLPQRLDAQLPLGEAEHGPARGALISDIADLAKRFAAILNLDRVEVRLETVTTDACRKFHADYVHARLITTYVGSGTQWLDSADVARLEAGEEPQDICALGTGDVGIFKGRLATLTPAIHRSPPIAGTGETRLLLVLNPPEDMRPNPAA